MKIVQPHRVTHTYTQRLDGSPGQVFPLLCPVRECDWVNGWDPRLVVSESGVAELDCTFVTGPADNEAVWVVSSYQPETRIEFFKVTPGETVGRITITLTAIDERRTAAEITYSYTALGDRGAELVNTFTTEHYATFMKEWEDELNYFLRTGTKQPRASS